MNRVIAESKMNSLTFTNYLCLAVLFCPLRKKRRNSQLWDLEKNAEAFPVNWLPLWLGLCKTQLYVMHLIVLMFCTRQAKHSISSCKPVNLFNLWLPLADSPLCLVTLILLFSLFVTWNRSMWVQVEALPLSTATIVRCYYYTSSFDWFIYTLSLKVRKWPQKSKNCRKPPYFKK